MTTSPQDYSDIEKIRADDTSVTAGSTAIRGDGKRKPEDVTAANYEET